MATLFDAIERPDLCARKHGGDGASAAAFARILPTISERQAECFLAIKAKGPHGCTAKDVAARLGVPLHTISGRLTELRAMGLIVKTTRRVPQRGWILVAVEA